MFGLLKFDLIYFSLVNIDAYDSLVKVLLASVFIPAGILCCCYIWRLPLDMYILFLLCDYEFIIEDYFIDFGEFSDLSMYWHILSICWVLVLLWFCLNFLCTGTLMFVVTWLSWIWRYVFLLPSNHILDSVSFMLTA